MNTKVLRLAILGEYYIPAFSPVRIQRGQTVRCTDEQAAHLQAETNVTYDVDNNPQPWFVEVESANESTVVDVDFTIPVVVGTLTVSHDPDALPKEKPLTKETVDAIKSPAIQRIRAPKK